MLQAFYLSCFNDTQKEGKMLEKINNNEEQTMSSLEIAELTEKRHDHVLRDIEKMFLELEYTPDLGATKTALYTALNGKSNRLIN